MWGFGRCMMKLFTESGIFPRVPDYIIRVCFKHTSCRLRNDLKTVHIVVTGAKHNDLNHSLQGTGNKSKLVQLLI